MAKSPKDSTEISTVFQDLQTTLVGMEQPFLAHRRAQIEFTKREIGRILEDFERTLYSAELVRMRHSKDLIGKSLNETMDIRRFDFDFNILK